VIFSHVYDYCISNPTQSKTSITTTKGHIGGLNRGNAQDGANIVGGELYNKLKNYLKEYLEDICQVRQYEFIREMIKFTLLYI
jgi:hypothetical protein